MSSIRQSLVLTFLSTNSTTAVMFLVTIVLARMLDPAEVGIFSITSVMVAVAHLFRDFGVASYLQHEKELTRDSVASAFGVLLVSSWTLGLVVFLCSWPAAEFYREPGVRDVMQVLALGFLFIPFGAVTHSLLTREYRAKEQAVVRLVGTLVYAASAITLASLGFSYMAMAWANLINIIVTALAYLPFRPALAPWWPRFKGWRKVCHFGAGATLGNSLAALDNAVPDLVLGRLSGAHDVGLMSRAVATTNILNQVIGPTISYAVLPFLSRAHHQGQALAEHMGRSVAYLTGLMWPAFLATALFAEPIIRALYGPNWVAAAPAVQGVCLWFALGTPFAFLGTAYMAIGRPYLTTAPALSSLALKGLAIAVLYDGTLASFVWAMVLSGAAMVPVNGWMQRRYLGLGWCALLAALGQSLRVLAVCGLAVLALRGLAQGWPAWAHVLLLAGGLPVVWTLAVWGLRHPLRRELEVGVKRMPWLARRLNLPTG